MLTSAEKTLRTSLRRSAMDFLARREHSRNELHDKLKRKYAEHEALFSEVLDQLEEDKLLSDDRFTEAYVRYRRNRGFGPLLIAQELRHKGVNNVQIDAHLHAGDEQWSTSLHHLIERKSQYVTVSQLDTKARQKLFRFCLSRGFASEQISRVLRGNLEL